MMFNLRQLISGVRSKAKRLLVPVLSFGLAVAVAIGSVAPFGFLKALAATPVFNNLPNDEPTIQVRKNGETTWIKASSVDLKAGDTAQFFIYVHNGVQDTTATNTRVAAIGSNRVETTHKLSGEVWADNAAPVSGVITVNSDTPTQLVVNKDSVKHYINQNNQYVEQPIGNTDGLFTNDGLLLGNINGCWPFLQAITFTATLQEPGQAAINTYKEVGISGVETAWHRDGVSTTPDNTAAFSVFVENQGTANSVLEKPTITDTLDNHLTYQPNSSFIVTRDEQGNDVRYNIPDNYIAFNGQTLTWAFNNLPAQPSRAFTLYFQATIAGESAFSVGTTRLLNTATVAGTENGATVSKGTNTVFIDVIKDSASTAKFHVIKYVQNLTSGSLLQDDTPVPAHAGDEVQYTIRLVNTGNTTATAQLRDILPTDEVTQSSEVQIKGASETASQYKTIDPQGLFSGGNGYLVIPNVQPGNGNGFDLRFNVKVNDLTAVPLSTTGMTITNTAQVYQSGNLDSQDNAYLTYLIGNPMKTDFTVQKFVQDPTTGQWVKNSNTKVREGQTINYRVDVINTGTSNLTIDSIRDVLPQFVTYIDGSLVIDPQISPTPVSNAADFFKNGIGGFAIYPGVTKRYEFSVRVNQCPDLGQRTLVNAAYLKAGGLPDEKVDTATIILNVEKPNF